MCVHSEIQNVGYYSYVVYVILDMDLTPSIVSDVLYLHKLCIHTHTRTHTYAHACTHSYLHTDDSVIVSNLPAGLGSDQRQSRLKLLDE